MMLSKSTRDRLLIASLRRFINALSVGRTLAAVHDISMSELNIPTKEWVKGTGSAEIDLCPKDRVEGESLLKNNGENPRATVAVRVRRGNRGVGGSFSRGRGRTRHGERRIGF